MVSGRIGQNGLIAQFHVEQEQEATVDPAPLPVMEVKTALGTPPRLSSVPLYAE